MTLSDLVRAVAVAGEQAMQATREAYAANVEALHQADPPEIPGQSAAGNRGVARHARSEADEAQDTCDARGV